MKQALFSLFCLFMANAHSQVFELGGGLKVEPSMTAEDKYATDIRLGYRQKLITHRDKSVGIGLNVGLSDIQKNRKPYSNVNMFVSGVRVQLNAGLAFTSKVTPQGNIRYKTNPLKRGSNIFLIFEGGYMEKPYFQISSVLLLKSSKKKCEW